MKFIAFRGLVRTLSFLVGAATLLTTASAQSTKPGPCVTTATMSIVFRYGTPQAEIDRVVAKVRRRESNGIQFYQADGRWTLTMYGATGSPGTACRFGYSFVPDGTIVPESGLGSGPSVLFSRFTGLFGTQALWKQKFRQMFDAWGNVSGLRYDEVPDDGASLHSWPGEIQYPGEIPIRGDLRISCISLTEPSVLAYNFFPNIGDMVINSDFNWADPASDYRFMRNTLGHEHGHGMGLGHVMPMSETKLMEPVLSTAFDGPQNDDIQGCQFLYGDRVEDNDDIAHATNVGMVTSGQSVELLAVERPADRDWFMVEIPQGFALTVRAEPVGETYFVGSQGGPPPILRDSRAINNLRLSAYQSDGVTLIGSSNTGGLGFPETLQSIQRPSSGVVSIKVDVSTIANDIQRYRLVFLLDGATTTFVPNSYTLLRGHEVSGGLFSLQLSDDVRLKLAPTGSTEMARSPVEFVVSSTSTVQNPSQLILGYEGASSSVNIRRVIHLFDFVAGTWVELNAGQSQIRESVTEFTATNPARFVAADGTMRAKFTLTQTGAIFIYPWENATDQIYWRLSQ
jgi:hypothetical protein